MSKFTERVLTSRVDVGDLSVVKTDESADKIRLYVLPRDSKQTYGNLCLLYNDSNSTAMSMIITVDEVFVSSSAPPPNTMYSSHELTVWWSVIRKWFDDCLYGEHVSVDLMILYHCTSFCICGLCKCCFHSFCFICCTAC